MKPITFARFFDKIGSATDGCWTWNGGRSPDGYGKFHVEGTRTINAHRWSYETFVGPIPPGLDLDHLCRNRSCVNPFHLEPVTRQENVLRGLVGSRTHCVHGHEYTPENTIWRLRANGAKFRNCRECQNGRRRVAS